MARNNQTQAEIDKKRNNNKHLKSDEMKSWCFEKIGTIDKPLSKLTTTQRKKLQINKISDKRMR